MGILPSSQTPFFNAKNFWAYKYTLYDTLINFKNIIPQYFTMFLENILKKFCEKKWYNQAMWFPYRKLLKTREITKKKKT